jgi:hypothetical protein
VRQFCLKRVTALNLDRSVVFERHRDTDYTQQATHVSTYRSLLPVISTELQSRAVVPTQASAISDPSMMCRREDNIKLDFIKLKIGSCNGIL